MGPEHGFTDCYRTELETALSPTDYVLLHSRAYNQRCVCHPYW